jgi:transcriptional regulator with XRE-family HTH domain
MTDLRELLAKNIKKFRKNRGFSQEMLAEKARTSTTHIGMIEIGKKFPSPKMIERIAEALGVDTTELFSTETVYFVSSHNKSSEMLYQDIINDFHYFEKTIIGRIKDLNNVKMIE